MPGPHRTGHAITSTNDRKDCRSRAIGTASDRLMRCILLTGLERWLEALVVVVLLLLHPILVRAVW